MAAKSNIGQFTRRGETPLFIAAREGSLEAVEFLLAAPEDESADNALSLAIDVQNPAWDPAEDSSAFKILSKYCQILATSSQIFVSNIAFSAFFKICTILQNYVKNSANFL